MDTTFLYRKIVDKSVLFQGFTIPVKFHSLFRTFLGDVPHGDSQKVKLLLDGELYDCIYTNQGFDKSKWNNHSDIIQFRYDSNQSLIKKIQNIFCKTYTYIMNEVSNRPSNTRTYIKVPENIQEFIQIHATQIANVFELECITCNEICIAKEELINIPEQTFEDNSIWTKTDPTANIILSNTLRHIRKLDTSIGKSLKRLYDYRCQMTGEKCGDEYAISVIEAHHIIPFTQSLNNDTSNIIILSPNYHRIIHKANPIFDKKQIAFIYPNGLVDKVKINKHLFFSD